MFLSALKLTKLMLKSRKAQEAEGGGAGGSIWFWVTVALFLACLAVFGYLVGSAFIANPGAFMAKITNAISKVKNIGG